MGKKPEQNVLVGLEEKFKQNLLKCLPLETELYSKTDVGARAIALLGQIISEDASLSTTQKEIVPIFDEVFADIVISLYFSACAMRGPAESILRRAFELGIAIIYLWDLPHAFCGWKSHDSDLNFNDMVEHLSSESYNSFVALIYPSVTDNYVFDEKKAKRLYRTLSNTIHGKIGTHIAYLPNRFSHDSMAWRNHLAMTEQVLIVLMNLHNKRFFTHSLELKKRMPALVTHREEV